MLKYNEFNKINEGIKGVKSKFWSSNDTLLLQYYAEDKTPEEIAKLLNEKNPDANLTYRDIIKRKSYLKKLGETKDISSLYKSHAEKWSDEELELLKRLVGEKYKLEDMAKILNMSIDRIKSKMYLMGKPKKLIKDGVRKNYYIKKTTPHAKLDTKHWYYNDVKKLVYLYDQGKNVEEIAKQIDRTEGAVKDMLTYYKTSLTAVRFGENWTEEEIKELESDKFVGIEFAKKWQRSMSQVNNKRERVVVSIRDADRLGKVKNVIREISRVEKIINSLKITPNSKIYDSVPKKNFVQRELYKSLTGINSSMLTLLGPTPERFLNLLSEYKIVGNGFIYSNEIDLETFIKTAKSIKKLNIENVQLTLGSVLAAYPQRLIDLDLTARWDTQNKLVKTLFNKQKKLINGDKYFMFTLSVRGEENLDIPTYIQIIIEELLNINPSINQEMITINNSLKVDKYNITSNSNYDIQVYRYADTSPMVSFLIKY